MQDVRGRYQSEGHWRPIVDDPKDGSDTAAWIGAQPWCDGGIGTMGSSYDGATQHALAIGNAPFVKAMVPRNAMSDFGRYGVRHNGAFELRWLNWVLTMGNAIPGTAYAPAAAARAASDPAAAAALVDLGTHVRDYAQNLPLRPGTTPLKFAPDYEAWLIEAMSHGDYDSLLEGPRLQRGGPSRRVQGRSRIPHHRLVRFLGNAGRQPQLRRIAQSQKEFAAADRRSVDSQLREFQLRGRGAVHRGRGARPGGVSPALVRSLAQGHRQRSGPRTARAHLRDGRRRCAQDAGGTAVRRRPLARRAGVAARARRGDALLSPRERCAVAGQARRWSAHHVPVRSASTRCPRSAEMFPPRGR